MFSHELVRFVVWDCAASCALIVKNTRCQVVIGNSSNGHASPRDWWIRSWSYLKVRNNWRLRVCPSMLYATSLELLACPQTSSSFRPLYAEWCVAFSLCADMQVSGALLNLNNQREIHASLPNPSEQLWLDIKQDPNNFNHRQRWAPAQALKSRSFWKSESLHTRGRGARRVTQVRVNAREVDEI
jgi:hypothetical protein